MPSIRIDIKDKELDKKVKLYAVMNDLGSKESAIIDILEKHFKKEGKK